LLRLFVIKITGLVKGELNLDKKWQSDDLFYITMNEIRPYPGIAPGGYFVHYTNTNPNPYPIPGG